MPTINQLIRKPRLPLGARNKVPALQASPQKRGVCTRVYTTTPKEQMLSPGRSRNPVVARCKAPRRRMYLL